MGLPPANQLFKLLPQTLDEIITLHRDICSLHLSSEADLAELHKTIVAAEYDAKDTLENWRIICLHRAEQHGGKAHILVGDATRAGTTWHTSPLVALDPGGCFALTESGSIYRLIGPKSPGEPPQQHLVLICQMLTTWGMGGLLGVMRVF